MLFLIGIAGVLFVFFGLFWLGWAIVKRVKPAVIDTSAGKVIERVADRTQDLSAMGALRLIRWMDEVEGNPKALAAWEVLYTAIGGTPYSPDTLALGTTATIPTAALTSEAQKAAATASEIHFTPKG